MCSECTTLHCGLTLVAYYYIFSILQNIVTSSKCLVRRVLRDCWIWYVTVLWWSHNILEYWKYTEIYHQRATHSYLIVHYSPGERINIIKLRLRVSSWKKYSRVYFCHNYSLSIHNFYDEHHLLIGYLHGVWSKNNYMYIEFNSQYIIMSLFLDQTLWAQSLSSSMMAEEIQDINSWRNLIFPCAPLRHCYMNPNWKSNHYKSSFLCKITSIHVMTEIWLQWNKTIWPYNFVIII